ncbi:helix-turn-helix domain-containing protein [Parafrankia sp. EUN1f]|uniref:winged helix-turn-helix transcriptional regulator n=1 Tax=Parafrankia sp. EUN1f TaxID=102897 RepID=UPI001E611E10|nr:helix-turn-helix domain-containing protein [Parafrankia sp. EUN1f]
MSGIGKAVPPPSPGPEPERAYSPVRPAPAPAGTTSPPPDDDAVCGVREIMDRVGDRWTIAVVVALGDGARRFSELRRGVEGISQRMLTVTLRGLERDGLVRRTVHPVIPPRVDYELTTLGRTLLDSVRTLMSWALDHRGEIDAARGRFDARSRATASAAS